jgi:hypothetical protein
MGHALSVVGGSVSLRMALLTRQPALHEQSCGMRVLSLYCMQMQADDKASPANSLSEAPSACQCSVY